MVLFGVVQARRPVNWSLIVEGDVLRDIGSMRRVRRVMLNGKWIR